jgi:hypothetical protein
VSRIPSILAIAVLSPAALFALSPVAAAKTRALVIGINAYPEIRVNGIGGARDLRGAANDARNMQKALISHLGVKPDEIRMLIDGDATRNAILAGFRDWLIGGTESGDRAIFYYAGHGAQVEDENGDEGDDKFDEVLVPSDTKGELEGPQAGLTGFITDDEIGRQLTELSDRDVLMIVDSCHSGTITRGALEIRKSGTSDDPAGQGVDADGSYTGVRTLTPNGPVGVVRNIEDLATRDAHRSGTRLIEVVGTAATPAAAAPSPSPLPPPSAAEASQLAVWTAAASAQLAVEDKEVGGSQGLFTNRFIKGISEGAADLNKNGNITASELLAFLRSESDSYCAKYQCGAGGLSPTLEASSGYDDKTFAKDSAASPSAPQEYAATIASTDALPQYGYPTGGVKVSLAGGENVHYGDPLRIKIESEYAGQLIVLDVRDDSTTVQLFPNTPSLKVGAETSITPGRPRSLPGDEDPFELVPDKVGSGRIVVLVVDPQVSLGAVTGEYLQLEPIPSPEDYIARISRALNGTVNYPSGSEDALNKPAKAGTLARGEAKYVIK